MFSQSNSVFPHATYPLYKAGQLSLAVPGFFHHGFVLLLLHLLAPIPAVGGWMGVFQTGDPAIFSGSPVGVP